MDSDHAPDVLENQDPKLVCTPSISNNGVLSKQNGSCSELKSLNKLQNLANMIKSEKEKLSKEAQDILGKVFEVVDKCCLFDYSSQYLLLDILINTVPSCKHSKNVLQNYVKLDMLCSTKCSEKCSTNANTHDQANKGDNCDVDDQDMVEVSIQDIVKALRETLSMVCTDDSQLVEEFQDLARKVNSAKNCVCELKTVWIMAQNMFLLQVLGCNKVEIKHSIDEIVSCLPSVNTPCEFESDTCPSLNDNDSCASDSLSSISLNPFLDDGCSIRTNSDDLRSRGDLESEFESKENGGNFKSINTNVPRQYLKITHIESPFSSDEFCNDFKMEFSAKYFGHNVSVSDSIENAFTAISGKSPKCDGSNEECEEKLEHSRFWMLSEPSPINKKSAKQQPEVHNNLSSHSSKSKVAESNEKPQHVQDTSNKSADNFLQNGKAAVDGQNSFPNSRTTSSTYSNSSNFEYAKETTKKIRTDTVEVKMTNRGDGFGLILGVKYNSTRSSIVPVIHSIKPKSPAHRSGVLKVDDRIISINRQNTQSLTPNQLQELCRRSFSSHAITLQVELDVVEVEPKFGTFDVILDKTLKIGLVFEDLKRGLAMRVSGIVKGSGAHRCGQLFPGDGIKFFRCFRNEEFDPVSFNYSKEESVLITVQRDPRSGFREKSGKAPPCYSNPCYSHVDSVPRRGKSFVLRKTMVHEVGGNNVLVMDQELTLFRDPVYWDFGFLVGEELDSGRAYVTDVRPDGPAADSNVVKKFDRIVQVNGVQVDRNIENSVLALLSQANHKVDLLIRRLYREEDSKTA